MVKHIHLVLCLCGFLSSQAFSIDDSASTRRPEFCIIEGQTYAIGETIPSLDPCESCECSEDGEKMCLMMACAHPQCGNPTPPPGECCPVCPEGCFVGDEHYDFGQTIPSTDPCESCECSQDGEKMCIMMACDEPQCSNPILSPDQCCPVCPDGCFVDDERYDFGETIPSTDPCESCECSQDGEKMCAIMMCALPQCSNPTFPPDQCCPVCPEGCFVGADHYDFGDIVSMPDPCEFCHCDNDGEIRCDITDCPPLQCDNPVHVLGQCCPVCPDGCYMNDAHYDYGTRIPSPIPCEVCKCTSENGIMCATMDCAEEPQCTNPVYVPDQCCPVCPLGCEVAGDHYEYGDVILNGDPCARCFCGVDGLVCEQVTCPPVNCINPVLEKGTCCPICPDGPNCAYGRRLVPANEVYRPNSLLSCSCLTEPWEPFASCQKRFGTKKARRILKRKSAILNPILLQALQQIVEP